jgi:hypothetical protein
VVKHAILVLLVMQTATLSAQEPEGRSGLLLGSASIAPGFMLHRQATNIYLCGHLEYYLEERISVRGRVARYMDAQGPMPALDRNDQLAFGPRYHFGRERLDLHIGVETGLSLTRPFAAAAEPLQEPLRALPTFALGAGLTWFVWDHFHFFADMRYH